MSLPLFLTATTANQIWQREYYIFDSKFWYTLSISPKKFWYTPAIRKNKFWYTLSIWP